MPKTDVELAITAISADLDRHVELLAEQAQSHTALVDLVSETRRTLGTMDRKLDEILRVLRPVADRVQEVDELRGRVARIDADVARLKANA